MTRSATSAALLALALALTAPGARPEYTVVVGAAIPLSGFLADLAADMRKGLLLWQEEVNAAGGLLGRRVELQLLDDQSRPAFAGKLYGELMQAHRAELLVGPFGSAASLGAAAVAERNRRVLVNATGAARAVHKANYRYVFQVPAPLGEYGAGAIEAALSLGLKKLFLLARDDPNAREMARQAQEEAERHGLSTAQIEVYGPGTTDYAPQVARARAAAAQGWLAFGLPQDAAEMVKSFRKLGYAPALFVAQGAADPDFPKLLGQDAELAIGISPYERGAATRGNAEFARAFARKWSAEPSHVAAECYAAAKVLEEAVRRAGSFDQELLREALAGLETETPLGRFRVDRSGAQIAAKPLLVQIQKGRREIVWPETLATARWQLPYPKWEERRLLR
jgi:branched-chain amino acid transport system substrate-binding protein